jgi:hypothetical protein
MHVPWVIIKGQMSWRNQIHGFYFVDDVMAIVHYFIVDSIWYVSRTLPVIDNFRITELEKCLAMPISCLSRGFAACQSCLSGKVIYSHQVEDSGQSIPFSHGDLSIIGYEKCINGWLKYLMTKSIRMASPLHGIKFVCQLKLMTLVSQIFR